MCYSFTATGTKVFVVVINNSMVGYYYLTNPKQLYILAESVIKGAVSNRFSKPINFTDTVIPATRNDFATFNLSDVGFIFEEE
jgi:hypothetical protein